MAIMTAAIIATPGLATPFKVVFSSGDRAVAEQAVTSTLSGHELIAALLPTLQGYEAGGG
jgi:hypothetical protein